MADRSAAQIAARATIIVALIGLVGTVVTVLIKSGDGGSKSDPVRVAAVSLTASARSFNSRCPITFRLNGKVDVEGGTGEVVYRWLRSDGFGEETIVGDRQRVAVSGPGPALVTDEWTPNVPYGDVARTTTLEVLEPRILRSAPLVISGRCDFRYPPNPPIPPPQVPGGPPG